MKEHCPATCGQCKRGKNCGKVIGQTVFVTVGFSIYPDCFPCGNKLHSRNITEQYLEGFNLLFSRRNW